MKLAFYKAFNLKATWLDNIIGIATLGRHSHVELIFSDGYSFSISPRGNGGRFKQIEFDPEHWDFVDLDIPVEDEMLLKLDALDMVGKKYDYLGALFSATPFCLQSSDKIFCSEAIVNILNKHPKYYGLGDGCKYSPAGLYKKLCTL